MDGTPVHVRPVTSSGERKQFLELPWRIQGHDPHWVPPLRGNQKELVGFARHPFYLRARSQAFLAWRGDRAVGRILAIRNEAYLERYSQDPCGHLGFFESLDDPVIAHALFDAGRHWLREQGLEVARGPLNPSLNYEGGLLVDGFHRPPTFMMTYNPPYYPALWESYGFRKAQDLLSFLGRKEDLSTLGSKVFFVVQEAQRRFPLRIRPIEKRRFLSDVRVFLDIYNRSNEGNWGHVPMSEAEMRHAAKGLRHLIVPELTRIAEFEGRPVGAIFGLLDYNPLIRKIDGRLFPFGFLTLFRQRRSIRRIRIVSANVLPEFKMWGIGVVLTAHLVPQALAWPIEEGEFSWVLESNHLSRKSIERTNILCEKTHRIYEIGGASAAT
ncbi:MAG TPA: N-acetyltransferase [Pirellulaceae bacterium]